MEEMIVDFLYDQIIDAISIIDFISFDWITIIQINRRYFEGFAWNFIYMA